MRELDQSYPSFSSIINSIRTSFVNQGLKFLRLNNLTRSIKLHKLFNRFDNDFRNVIEILVLTDILVLEFNEMYLQNDIALQL